MTNFVVDMTSTKAWARREAEAARERIDAEEAYTITDGVMRWNSNGRVVPTEWYEFAAYLGYPVDVEACDDTSRDELVAFLSGYKEAQAARTPEQIAEEQFEARAALGPDQTVVNILTGERYTT